MAMVLVLNMSDFWEMSVCLFAMVRLNAAVVYVDAYSFCLVGIRARHEYLHFGARCLKGRDTCAAVDIRFEALYHHSPFDWRCLLPLRPKLWKLP